MLVFFAVVGIVLIFANSSLLEDKEEEILYVLSDDTSKSKEVPKDKPQQKSQPQASAPKVQPAEKNASMKDAENILDDLYNN